jgi:hypothetical protein
LLKYADFTRGSERLLVYNIGYTLAEAIVEKERRAFDRLEAIKAGNQASESEL